MTNRSFLFGQNCTKQLVLWPYPVRFLYSIPEKQKSTVADSRKTHPVGAHAITR